MTAPGSSTGSFVAIDGPTGIGKTTVTALLADHLAAQGWPVVATKEPTATALGDTARYGTDDYHGLTLACLVTADRYHHLDTEIRPALATGKLVICDRYLATSLVLQRLDGVDAAYIWALNLYVDRPDLTIILTGDPAHARARASHRGTYSRFHRGGLTAGQAEAKLYQEAVQELTDHGFTVVGHNIEQRPAEQVATALVAVILNHIGHRAP